MPNDAQTTAEMPGREAARGRYIDAIDGFDRDAALREFFPSGNAASANACEICCDRHADDPKRIALRYRTRDGGGRDMSFAELKILSSKLAGLFTEHGIGKCDVIAGLLPRTPELLATIMAAWRIGAIYQPLFTAFGPKSIEHRVAAAKTRLIVTDRGNRAKLDGLTEGSSNSASLHPAIVTVGADPSSGDLDFVKDMEGQSDCFAPVSCGIDHPFLMMFTSGTTGPSKPLTVPIRAIPAFVAYMRDAVGLRPGDRFWNVADPGWAYGLYYAVTGPLALGLTTTFYDGPFTVEATYETIKGLGITNLAGAPTAFRLLVAAGPEAAAGIKGQLRAVSSAGEPLNPEVIRWFAKNLGTTIHDHYGQTELGMVLCNHHDLEHLVHLGSAGFAVPGHRVVVVDEAGTELSAGVPGILALDRTRSPLMWFSGYHERETTAFVGDYYLSGDTVEMNEDGSISFVGRSDDVITSAGYRIGPFDVESALIEHPAVVESAVVGKPDAERTELVKAFVVLKPGFAAGTKLADEIRDHVKARLSAVAYPREIEFVDSLPRTPSGKLQRFILRQQEIAKAKGDTAA